MAYPVQDRSVTAIIATYNRGRMIEQSIDSILQQSAPVAQFIVVDDGSTDDTEERVRRYGDRIEYLRKPNGGKSSAINLAMTRARGEWVWLFDDDDIALPDATRRLLDALARDESADFAFGGQVIAQEAPDGTLVGHRPVPPLTEAGDGLLLDVLQGFCFRLQAMLIRRRCLIEAGGLDERYLRGQDYELIVRLARRHRGVRVQEPVLVWRQHAGDRGPAALRHSAADSDRSWEAFDAMLGREVRSSFELREYLVPRPADAALGPEERTVALLHRAAVMGTKGLLAEFVDDLAEAASGNDARGLSQAQRELLTRTALNPRFLARLASSPVDLIQPLRHTPRSRLLRQAMAATARALVYAARSVEASPSRRLRYLRSAVTLAAFAGPRSVMATWGGAGAPSANAAHRAGTVKPDAGEAA
jgi:hypothetical protein